MYKKRLVTKDTYYVGASERRLALFENVYPLNNGVSYNSYLILDEKTCLLDSVDKSVENVFIKKVVDGLNGRKLDYLVVNHMEPDHAYTLKRVIDLYPEVNVVLNDKTLRMFKNFNNGFEPKNFTIVKEMDQLVLGKHTLVFIFAIYSYRLPYVFFQQMVCQVQERLFLSLMLYPVHKFCQIVAIIHLL